MSILVSLIKDIFGRKNAKDTARLNELLSSLQTVPAPEDAAQGSIEQEFQAALHLHQCGRLDEAASAYRAILHAYPTHPLHGDVLFSLAVVYEIQHRDEALDCFRRVAALDPTNNVATMCMLHLMQQRCDWNELEDNVPKMRSLVRNAPLAGKNHLAPLSFLMLPGTTAMEHKRCAQRYAQLEYRHLDAGSNQGLYPQRGPNDKIRLGYLSADFRQHAVSHLMAEIFELHDRERFHVTAYSYGQDDGSAMRRRLEKAFDAFADVEPESIEATARRIRQDRIDVLVDLTGYTQNTRSGILALRPAPVQVNYLGYPGTMGSGFVDYMIADRFVIPDEYRECYTEKVVWLPDCFLPANGNRQRRPAPPRRDCGLPEQGFVFCCFNQPNRISPQVFDIWCRLLAEIPDSVLWLPAGGPHVEANLRREAERRGVNAERIILAPRLPDIADHLARLQCADLFLDTHPYNAHTNCSDALLMGLPVVTCAGETFPSRVAGSMLSAIGAPELIAYTLDDYYRLALGLATDRENLAAIRRKIAGSRDHTPLFDSARYTRNLEHAYVQMMAEHATVRAGR